MYRSYMGYGRRSVCGCAGFVERPGYRDICNRCGHNYSEHW